MTDGREPGAPGGMQTADGDFHNLSCHHTRAMRQGFTMSKLCLWLFVSFYEALQCLFQVEELTPTLRHLHEDIDTLWCGDRKMNVWGCPEGAKTNVGTAPPQPLLKRSQLVFLIAIAT